MTFLAGIALLCRAYTVCAADPAGRLPEHPFPTHSSRNGRGVFYCGTIASIRTLFANTSYRIPTTHSPHRAARHLPHVFMIRGRRLLYSHGI
jgi:hypothetical protein